MLTGADIPADRHVLIAGPTASGKSALALEIAERDGGVIVNADALQVWSCWRILTARPDPAETARAPHALFGHIAPGDTYSVGHWLRDVRPLLSGPERAIIVGGTGLYLTALTEGLAQIPPVPQAVRTEADRRMEREGAEAMAATLDAATRARIDLRNPARVQRAWEVLQATGRGLAAWHDETGPPLLPSDACTRFLVDVPRAILATRIGARFDAMMEAGALAEVRAVLPMWDPRAPWARAIGARELVAHLRGESDLDAAVEAAKTASRRYAKRQRTWLRSNMNGWIHLPLAAVQPGKVPPP
jgi:tRNA dimethylallyltransferase